MEINRLGILSQINKVKKFHWKKMTLKAVIKKLFPDERKYYGS